MDAAKKNKNRDGLSIVLEIVKWGLVIWLLWPMRNAMSGPMEMGRVVLGVVLFIIFAGKLLYDTVIMGIVRQKRYSARQDFFSMIGIVLVLAVIVGLLIFFVGYVLVEIFRLSRRTGEE